MGYPRCREPKAFATMRSARSSRDTRVSSAGWLVLVGYKAYFVPLGTRAPPKMSVCLFATTRFFARRFPRRTNSVGAKTRSKKRSEFARKTYEAAQLTRHLAFVLETKLTARAFFVRFQLWSKSLEIDRNHFHFHVLIGMLLEREPHNNVLKCSLDGSLDRSTEKHHRRSRNGTYRRIKMRREQCQSLSAHVCYKTRCNQLRERTAQATAGTAT